MIRRITKIQLVAFVVISVVGIVYVGLNYIGLNPADSPYTVKLMLATNNGNLGGIFTNADVTERGVDVGRVGSLTPRGNQVEVKLELKKGSKIPSQVHAVVSNLSAVGEQYVDLQPDTDSGPYLHAGSVIPASKATVPLDDATLLVDLDKLVSSVDDKHLAIVIDELGKGFQDIGPALQELIDNGNALTQDAINNLPQQLKLIDDSRTVLDTQRAVASELKSWAASFADFSDQLRVSDPDLRAVIDNGVGASRELTGLLADNASALPTLLGNLITFQQIQQVRLPWVKAILQLLPPQIAGGFYVTPGDGTAHFGMVQQTSQDQPQNPCVNGYQSTKKRGNNGGADWGGPANLNAWCQGDSVDDQRGARYAVRPSGDNANVTNADPYPGPVYGQSSHPTVSQQRVPTNGSSASKSSAAGPTGGSSQSATTMAAVSVPYNPSTGAVTGADGKTYQLGYSGPLAPIFGSNSWEWLLLAPTMR